MDARTLQAASGRGASAECPGVWASLLVEGVNTGVADGKITGAQSAGNCLFLCGFACGQTQYQHCAIMFCAKAF
jgi:hypothetical protein